MKAPGGSGKNNSLSRAKVRNDATENLKLRGNLPGAGTKGLGHLASLSDIQRPLQAMLQTNYARTPHQLHAITRFLTAHRLGKYKNKRPHMESVTYGTQQALSDLQRNGSSRVQVFLKDPSKPVRVLGRTRNDTL